MAGCSGLFGDGGDGDGDGTDGDGSDNGGQQLGERVETVVTQWWPGFGIYTSIFEGAVPTVAENIQALGVDHNDKSVEVAQTLGEIYNDERTHHLSYMGHGQSPNRLDPHQMTRRWAVDRAGGDGENNLSNYASCEFTDPAVAQAKAQTEEERRELVYEAHSVMSEDMMVIPFAPHPILGVINVDNVDPGGIGKAGPKEANPYPLIYSTPTNGDTLSARIQPTTVETPNIYGLSTASQQYFWTHVPHSSLVEFDENNELQPMLAEDWEFAQEGSQITFTLREGLEFHNGDPITAEDVKFTFEMLASGGSAFVLANELPYSDDGIVVVDDRTIEFNFDQAYTPFLTRVAATWGIVHSDSWREAGAMDSPEQFSFADTPMVGSGPFQVDSYTPGASSISLSPYDNHPVHDPDHNLSLIVYSELTTAIEAFNANEVDMIFDVSPSEYANVRDSRGEDYVFSSEGFTPFELLPQHPRTPVKFQEFREAVAMSLNRREIVDIAFLGTVEPLLDSTVLTDAHPYGPPSDRLTQMTDSETGDVEGAKARLEEAGWGWDDNGNLRYPPDADLSPMWPAGEEPSPDDFPCLNDL